MPEQGAFVDKTEHDNWQIPLEATREEQPEAVSLYVGQLEYAGGDDTLLDGRCGGILGAPYVAPT